MLHIRIGVIVLVAFLMGAAAIQDVKDDKKKEEKPGTKLKGYLPTHYKKLGLSAEQIQQIYKFRADYKTKTDELKKKMEKLKVDERKDLESVLTPGQLKKLRQLQTGEKP